MLADLVQTMRNDAALAAELADAPWGGPAIYTQWAPDYPRPYITLDYSEGLDSLQISAGQVVIDAWGDGTSVVALEPIRDALRDLLDHAIIDTSRGPFRLFWTSDSPEREDEPQVVRWRMTYDFRRSMSEHVTT